MVLLDGGLKPVSEGRQAHGRVLVQHGASDALKLLRGVIVCLM